MKAGFNSVWLGRAAGVVAGVLLTLFTASAQERKLVAPSVAVAPAEAPMHLSDWLRQHSALPPAEQEKQLRKEPAFSSLAPQQQTRVLDQLHQLNQLSEGQRDRRLARAETLDYMTAEDRARVNTAVRNLVAMPPERRVVMRNAFRDLRILPPAQRLSTLNSPRYQGSLTLEERGILGELLRVEPYQPPR